LILALLSIAIAYLLGSVSSSYIVACLTGNFDIKDEPDGQISAATIYYRTGVLPCLTAIIMDILLAASSVIIARMLTDSANVMMISGFAAVAGHNWSIFLKLKGGLGATAIGGALAAVAFWPLFYGLITAGIVLLLTSRPRLSTALGILMTSGTIIIRSGFEILAIYPLTLFVLMLLKEFQVGRLAGTSYEEKPLCGK
jgi:glycerol-3-phosphate acyltransferase PlsY